MAPRNGPGRERLGGARRGNPAEARRESIVGPEANRTPGRRGRTACARRRGLARAAALVALLGTWALLAAACSQAVETGEGASAPGADATAAAPAPSTVRFTTEDGWELVADWIPAARKDAPAVVLLHQYRSNRRSWTPLVPRLHRAGLHVLALDQRAHGDSTRQGERTVRVEDLPRARFADLVRAGPKDVAAARKFLESQGVPAERIALVGASYGCTVALLTAERRPHIVSALALLSPGIAYFDIDVTNAARTYRGPLLAIAAEDDPQAEQSARRIVELHEGPEELVIYPTGGHGTQLLVTRPEVLERLVGFLARER